ncbi:Uncharacterized protein GBIM_07044 [Gryllus bimaculatus]|nr:Uncharacterized protein GBIM_07044 [Gryllus bimaculatus]
MKSPSASSVLLLALAVVALAHVGRAAVALEKVVENPMYPRHCKDSSLNRYFADRTSWFISGQCLKRNCNFPHISTFSCASVSVEPPCTLVVDNTLRYPQCCPQARCPSLETSNVDYNDI